MIGVLDSGRGGDNTTFEIRKLFPMLDILLLKDIKNAPYGTKSKEELIKITEKNINALAEAGAAKIIIGCCTASTVWDSLSENARSHSIPIIEPTAALAKSLSRKNKIALIATKRTVNDGAFSRAVGDNLTFALALQGLVTLAEAGACDGKITREEGRFLDYCLSPLENSGADTLILGCTHFPQLEKEILKRAKKYGIKKTASSTFAAALELSAYPEAFACERGLTVNI